jgi:L,D-peptidoglycan transpeptidase YkuD (ErfK/YbiS/YcfS/YnhG family)
MLPVTVCIIPNWKHNKKRRFKPVKKCIALLLVLLMIIGMNPATAEEVVPDSGNVLSDQVEGLHVNIQHMTDSPAWVTNLPAAQEADQLFVVAAMGMDKTTAYITMHRKDDSGVWKQILSSPGFVGRYGLCLDADHAEGCGQTPVGVYHFNKAFGIAADPGCALPYIQVDDNIYWSGDPDRHYNEMVDIRDVPDLVMDDSEHIVDYEYQYQYCLNISFNEDGTPGRGSAIFLHCFGPAKPYTGGCVAVPENTMRMIMQQVSPECVVVIDTFENLGASF